MNTRCIGTFIVLLCMGGSSCPRIKNTIRGKIPVEYFVESPTMINPQISPLGTSILYGKSDKGLYIRSIKSGEEVCAISHIKDAFTTIDHYFFSRDERKIFFLASTENDEQTHFFSFDMVTHEIHDYTPFNKVRVTFISYAPTKILLGINQRDPRFHDVYTLDLATGDVTLLEENTAAIIQWYATKSGEIIMALRTEEDGSYTIIKKEASHWYPLRSISYENIRSFQVLEINELENYILILDAGDYDLTHIFLVDLTSGKEYSLFSHRFYDIASYNFRNLIIQGDKQYSYWHSAYKKDIQYVKKKIGASSANNLSFVSSDDTDTVWIIKHETPTISGDFWLYNRKTKCLKKLAEHLPHIKCYAVAKTKSFQCTARDGLKLSGYILLPHRRKKRYPLVVFVHGGPWEQEESGFHVMSQFLANRGYAVLRINFRGSAGFGKKFLNAANHEWGGTMHTDILDAIMWVSRHWSIDHKKIVICGESYGGYEALMAALLNPDLVKGAISIGGPVDLVSWLNALPEYWKPYKNEMYKRIGNPCYERGFLKKHSPITYCDAIKSPILFVHGMLDCRVPWSEHTRIIEALQKNNIFYDCLMFANEGHHILHPPNRKTLFERIELFLEKIL